MLPLGVSDFLVLVTGSLRWRFNTMFSSLRSLTCARSSELVEERFKFDNCNASKARSWELTRDLISFNSIITSLTELREVMRLVHGPFMGERWALYLFDAFRLEERSVSSGLN